MSRPRSFERSRVLTASETRDVIVIGGGPAGAMTARGLAILGHDVLLVEEHETIGTPVHCTGLMGADAFSRFDLPRESILGEAVTARFWGVTGNSVAASSAQLNPVIIDRARFDTLLAAQAEQAGAEVRRGWRAARVVVEPQRTLVTFDQPHPPVSARALVLACGASYRFHRPLKLGLPNLFLQSAQLETPFPLRSEIEVRFGREVAPAGFAWLVPVTRDARPYARIGLMSASKVRDRFRRLVTQLAPAAGIDPADLPAPRLRMLPLGPVARTFSDRVVAVGDAAGLVKPTTGGGIHYSLLSGSIAAETLDGALRRNRLDEHALARYERNWRQQLGREIRVGLAFRRIAARLSDDSIDEIIELARVDGVIPLLQKNATFNWHRKAAIALLAHPSFRRIVFRSLSRRDGII